MKGLQGQLVPGDRVGQYRVDGVLGQGAMGTVYLAWQESLERHVALKILPPEVRGDPEALRRLRQEAVIAGRLRHPSIVAVHDYGWDGETAYLVTDLVEGGTLADRLGEPLPLADVLDLLRPVAAALDFAHAEGVLHRDVKPTNILLSRDGRAVLADFGLVKVVGTAQTLAGVVLGTPHYMAPEQASGGELDGRADIYALGVVAYQALTGALPFEGESGLALLLAHLRDDPPPPRRRAPWLAPETEAALLSALAKSPALRPPTALEFLERLAGAATARRTHPRIRGLVRSLGSAAAAVAVLTVVATQVPSAGGRTAVEASVGVGASPPPAAVAAPQAAVERPAPVVSPSP